MGSPAKCEPSILKAAAAPVSVRNIHRTYVLATRFSCVTMQKVLQLINRDTKNHVERNVLDSLYHVSAVVERFFAKRTGFKYRLG